MRIRTAVIAAVAAALLATSVASAHVTLNPNEWEAGGFARLAVRVPNERPDASTTEVTMQFPENVISASFEDVPGWERTIEMAQLDAPIEEEGEEPITERIATVTWTGGEVEPGEFVEFGVSFQVPEDATEPLLFPTLQTYSDGEIVRWISPDEEADTPAPRVDVLPAAGEAEPAPTTTEEGASAEAAPAAASGDDDDSSGRATLALVLGIAGLLAGLTALGVALTRRPRDSREVATS
jgi:periplasmic copper chaperone A